MKTFKLILTTVAISMAMFSADAEEKKTVVEINKAAKERTVKGTIMCGKCTLKKKTELREAQREVARFNKR